MRHIKMKVVKILMNQGKLIQIKLQLNNLKKDKNIKNIKEVDPIDILMKDTRVTGEKLNQLNDWMDDL